MSRLSRQALVGAMDWKLALRRCVAIGFSGGSLFLGQMILTGVSGEQTRPAAKTIPESNVYRDQIHPLLAEHCQACHNSEVKKGGLDLSTPAALLKGGDSGPSIVGGSAKTSLLYKLVAHEQEPTMPYKMDKLPNAAIAQLAVWINAGAPFDTAESNGRVAAGGSVNLSLQTGGLGGDPAGGRLFTEKVRPVLELQCLNCHGGKFKQAGLSMVSRDTLLKGSDNGPVVIAGNAANSLLVKKLKHEHEPGMPYKAPKLAEDVIGGHSKRVVDIEDQRITLF
jgi:mono/diheme cytochrome c family protein